MSFEPRVYLSTYLTTLLIQGCTVLQGMLLARMLGPEGRGEFAVIQLWPSVFATLGLFGAHFVFARRAGVEKNADLLIRDSITVSCLTAILTGLFCFAVIPILIPEKNHYLTRYMLLFVVFVPLYQIRTIVAAVDQGSGNFRLLNISRALLYPAFFGGLILVWFLSNDRLLGAVFALLAANLAVVAFRVSCAGQLRGLGVFQISPLGLLRKGLPYQVTIFFQLSSQYVDQVILLWLLSPVDLAMYIVARSSASVIGSLPSSLGLISLSEATRLNKHTGFEPLARTLRRGGLVVLLLGVSIAPLFQFLIPLIYGNGFSPAIPLAVYLMVGVIALGLSEIIEQTLRGHGTPMVVIAPKSIGLAVLVAVGVLCVPRYGSAAVAVGFSISQFVVLSLLVRVILVHFCHSSIRHLIPRRDDFKFIVNQLKYFPMRRWLSGGSLKGPDP